MNNDRQVAFRLPSNLVEEIDAQAESWSTRVPGVRVTRADVVRALLVKGLEGETVEAVEASNGLQEMRVEPRLVEQNAEPRTFFWAPSTSSTGLVLASVSMDED